MDSNEGEGGGEGKSCEKGCSGDQEQTAGGSQWGSHPGGPPKGVWNSGICDIMTDMECLYICRKYIHGTRTVQRLAKRGAIQWKVGQPVGLYNSTPQRRLRRSCTRSNFSILLQNTRMPHRAARTGCDTILPPWLHYIKGSLRRSCWHVSSRWSSGTRKALLHLSSRGE